MLRKGLENMEVPVILEDSLEIGDTIYFINKYILEDEEPYAIVFNKNFKLNHNKYLYFHTYKDALYYLKNNTPIFSMYHLKQILQNLADERTIMSNNIIKQLESISEDRILTKNKLI
jgi:hypothetical protein